MSNIRNYLKQWARIGLAVIVLSLALTAALPVQASAPTGYIELDCDAGELNINWYADFPGGNVLLAVNGAVILSNANFFNGVTAVPGVGNMVVEALGEYQGSFYELASSSSTPSTRWATRTSWCGMAARRPAFTGLPRASRARAV